jgi:hypothetical protein
MSDMKVLIARFSTITILTLSSLLLGACGGGGGGGDGGVSPPPVSPPPPPPPTGGITRTGIAVGAITGFGSVIVNGVRYETSAATSFSRDDDNDSTEAEFEVGEVVVVEAEIDDSGNASATAVTFEDAVEGPVTSAAPGQIVVMGQTVNIGTTTSIDDSCPASLDDASIVAVEVSGLPDANGVIDATRIECKFNLAEVGEFEVNGVVSAHDATARTFMIGSILQVDYSAAAVDNFPGGTINDGDPVEAKGTDFDSGTNVLTATRVEYKGVRLDDAEDVHLEIDGFVTGFVSETDFSITSLAGPIPITTIPGTTVYEGGSAADLANNLKIEVEGDFDANGVLVATKIEIKDSTNIRVVGLDDSVIGDVITILNISVNTSTATTRFEDKRDDTDPFRVGDIAAGDYVEARGQEQPPGQITAFLIERDDSDPDSELRGFVEDGSVNGRNSFVILGVTVDTSSVSPGNYFTEDAAGNDVPITADAFWDAVGNGGVIVDVTGSETGTSSMQARELQLEPLD